MRKNRAGGSRRSKQLRRILFKKSPNCYHCQRVLTPLEATLEHLIPYSKGGRSNLTNCVLACEPCNIARGNTDLAEWKGRTTSPVQV